MLAIPFNRKCFSERNFVQIYIYLLYVFGGVIHFRTVMEKRAPWKKDLVLRGFFATCFLGLRLLFHSTDFSVVICGIQIYSFLTDSCFSDSCFVLTSVCWEWWDFLTVDVSGNRLLAVCSLTIPYNYFILAPLPRGQYLVPTDPPTALSDYFVM